MTPLALFGLPDALWFGAGATLLVSLMLLALLFVWGRSLRG